MAINLQAPDIRELKPRITVFGCGGAGGNAVNNMISTGLLGVEFVVANTDAQALTLSKAERVIQMGLQVTGGLGAGSQPEVGRAAAEEVLDEIRDQLSGAHMVFITAGMGGGTGTGAAPVVAQAARDMGILTVGVVTKPFQFEGARRMKVAEAGINELQQAVDTLIVIPNQNLFRVANEKTTFADAFAMADRVLYSGVACITDLMVKEGLINLDFADVRSIMRGMGKAMMGTGEATGEKRAMRAAEAAIANPLLDDVSMKGARGVLISITGGNDLTLYEVDEAATHIREQVDHEANIIMGATFDETLEGTIRVSVVATGIDHMTAVQMRPAEISLTDKRIAEVAERLRAEARSRQAAPASVPSITTRAPAGEVMDAYQPQPVAQPAPVMQAPVMQAPVMQAPVMQAAAPVQMAAPVQVAQVIPQAIPQPMPQARPEIAAAIARHPDVQVIPAQPRAPLAAELPAMPRAPVQDTAPAPGPFIPPQAEPVMRAPRMPNIEDLPLPAQNQMRARQAEAQPERKSVGGFLNRLVQATQSVTRREDEGHHAPAAPQQPAPAPRQQPVSPIHSEYAKRPQAAGQARPAAPQAEGARQGLAARTIDDDQLEIPAFLRRQSN
jgi:cell division protein FtsZ